MPKHSMASLPNTTTHTKRSIQVDFLRSLAIAAVVCLHTLPIPLLHHNGLYALLISSLVGSLSKIGVPLFLIISGYLMLDRDYSGNGLKRFLTHNYFPLFISFELWCIISTTVQLFLHHSFENIYSMLRTMLFVGEPNMVHFWYMQMLLGIYLSIPLLASFMHNMQNGSRYIELIAGIGTVFIMLIPTIQMILEWFDIQAMQEIKLGGFAGQGALGIFYMLLGYFIKKDTFHLSRAFARRTLFASSFFLLWIISSIEIYLTKKIFTADTGFLPIALFTFALSNAIIYSPIWSHCKAYIALSFKTIAQYAYGIYMTHILIHAVAEYAISPGSHLLRIAALNPISTFVLSILCCLIINAIPSLRKNLLLIK